MPHETVRPPAVAGMFYPADPAVLRSDVEAHLAAAARIEDAADKPPVKALIAPHAGYVYSGPVAGSAFAAIASEGDRIKRIVLLGPAHRVALRGLALAGADAFETPLGSVAADAEAEREILDLPQVSVDPGAHADEHSLEVEIPFLQILLRRFTLLALVVGDAAPTEVAQVLDRVWGGKETLIVISSDLSHYLSYEEACERDSKTADKILELGPTLSPYEACGARAVNGLLAAAGERSLSAELLDLRNSGDTAAGRSEVVGYGAFSFRTAA
ncbi:MAG: AmmeMemoRadiSam system protein B [Acidobacteriota bacterium]|nr:AmmeMemoRadiSam system protein B [Acidobacteriota bacterium]